MRATVSRTRAGMSAHLDPDRNPARGLRPSRPQIRLTAPRACPPAAPSTGRRGVRPASRATARRRLGHGPAAGPAGSGVGPAGDAARGSRTTTRNPGPASSSQAAPPCAWAVARTMARPSPAPLVSPSRRARAPSSVVNRSNARSWSHAAMPGPSSVTVTRTDPSAAAAATVTRPRAYRTALSIRLTSIRRSASASPATGHGSGADADTGTRACAYRPAVPVTSPARSTVPPAARAPPPWAGPPPAPPPAGSPGASPPPPRATRALPAARGRAGPRPAGTAASCR